MSEAKSIKKELEGNLLSPLPIVLVGAMVNNQPNYLVIGYSSPFDFGKHIFISLYKKRYTRIGIHENRTFSVNIPSEDLLAETNICGSKSGRDFDKGSLFDTFYGELKTAPMIRQCPINMECEVTEILDYDPNEGIIGRVIKSYADPRCITDGKLDWRKVHPIIWATGGDFNYYQLGERIINGATAREVGREKMLNFCIVDVFTEEKYAGNQLAVIRDAKNLSDVEMQRIAKEMNYSETTFILSDEKRNGGYDVRIFTPEIELPFAGHPTLGTAYVIQHEIVKEPIDTIVLNLKVGQIPVTLGYSEGHVDTLWMKQLQPTFGQVFDVESISQVLSLDSKELDSRFPIQEVSTGGPSIIVPLKTLDALKRARIIRDKYFKLIKDIQAKAILIFCPETYNQENDLNVRFFADYYGIPEDPATGSANGCLAGYLVKHRYFRKDRINIRVEQGYEIGRPSLLLLKAQDREGKIDVYVGGTVAMTARGELI